MKRAEYEPVECRLDALEQRLRLAQQVRTNLAQAGVTKTPVLDRGISWLEDAINLRRP